MRVLVYYKTYFEINKKCLEARLRADNLSVLYGIVKFPAAVYNNLMIL